MKPINFIKGVNLIVLLFLSIVLSGQEVSIFEGNDGIEVSNSQGDGISISDAGDNGIQVFGTVNDGVSVLSAGQHGVYVNSAGLDGIFVNVNSAGRWGINIQGAKSGNPATPEDHIGLIYNKDKMGGGDVLALKVDLEDPGNTSNFITFFDSSETRLGQIQGDGSGGVTYESSTADFAEYLPVYSLNETFQSGDVVGIINGKISLMTVKADQVMVITDQPIVLGNGQEDPDQFEKVSFLGQVPVRVSGPALAGEWIVASGLNDGTATAMPDEKIKLDHQIVGLALESNLSPGLKKVNTLVGLDHSRAKDYLIKEMQRKIELQQSINQKLQSQISELKEIILKTPR